MIDGAARKRIIAREEPLDDFVVVQTLIAQKRDRSRQVRHDLVFEKEFGRNRADRRRTVANVHKLSVLDEALHARHRNIEDLGDVRKWQPRFHERIQAIDAFLRDVHSPSILQGVARGGTPASP